MFLVLEVSCPEPAAVGQGPLCSRPALLGRSVVCQWPRCVLQPNHGLGLHALAPAPVTATDTRWASLRLPCWVH